jgi:hypothetical protein
MNHTFTPISVGNAHGVSFISLLLIALIVLCVGWLAFGTIYTRYIGLTRWRAALLWVLSFAAAMVGLVIRLSSGTREDKEIINSIFFIIILFMFSAPFGVRLYRKWVGSQLTDAEKLPGMDGVRAWLTTGNLICAILIPICLWQTFQFSLPAMFALTFGLLLAYPVFNMASAAPQPAPAAPAEDLSAEREKVLRLLEAGKITADESAELLNALGQSVPQRPPLANETEISPARKIVLLGATLLLLGFFLPWFAINPGRMLSEAAGQMQQMMGGTMPGNAMPQMNFPTPNTGTVQVHAGDVARGLGWWILALGIGAALLPFLATNLKAQLQKKVSLAALAIGAFLLIYLLSDAVRYVSIGVILALAGYALEFVGTLKERTGSR